MNVHEPCLEVLCLNESDAGSQLSLDFEELLRLVRTLSKFGVLRSRYLLESLTAHHLVDDV